MGQDLDKAENRLQNIQAVSPILGALRTISLSNWQMALNKRKNILLYSDKLIGLVPFILPAMQTHPAWYINILHRRKQAPESKVLVIGLGTERGLCGRYNHVLGQFISGLLAEHEGAGSSVVLGILGSRLARSLLREDVTPSWVEKLPMNTLPSYIQAYSLVTKWLQEIEKGDFRTILIAYNKQEAAGRYGPCSVQLLPPILPSLQASESWPPYIVETDPVHLFTQVIVQWTGLHFHSIMLEAAITEHSARFQLMESATQNAERLVEELTISVQGIRRQQITREIQELAIGAGLVG